MANAAENERYLEELLSSLKEVQIQSVGEQSSFLTSILCVCI